MATTTQANVQPAPPAPPGGAGAEEGAPEDALAAAFEGMLGRVLAGLPAELQERARDAAWERLDEAAEALAAIDPPLRAAFVEKPWLEWRGGVAYLRPEHAAEVPTAVVGVGRCPVLLGGEVRYHTEQDGERITVFVPRSRLRAGPAEAQVEITAGTLLVRERGALPGDALVHGRLWEAVAPKGSSWTEDGEDGGLRITLAKAPGGRYPWPHLLQDAPERFGGQEEVSRTPWIRPSRADPFWTRARPDCGRADSEARRSPPTRPSTSGGSVRRRPSATTSTSSCGGGSRTTSSGRTWWVRSAPARSSSCSPSSPIAGSDGDVCRRCSLNMMMQDELGDGARSQGYTRSAAEPWSAKRTLRLRRKALMAGFRRGTLPALCVPRPVMMRTVGAVVLASAYIVASRASGTASPWRSTSSRPALVEFLATYARMPASRRCTFDRWRYS